MDLSTIREKLNLGKYADPWECINDIQLMFDNAWLYNRKTSKVYKYCSRVMLCVCLCRGVLYTDSVSRPFMTIYIVYSSTLSIGRHGNKQKKVPKGPKSSTDSDQNWHTPRGDQGASTQLLWHVGNSPNSKKVDFSPKFRKFIS